MSHFVKNMFRREYWPFWLCLLTLIFVAKCSGDELPAGVIGMDKVVKLPEDGTKWHISVVGSGARYTEVVGWFESEPLKSLRAQIHFHPISDKTGIQAYRVKGIPTVRFQDDEGKVIYEACGDSLPVTALGLYGAMARAQIGRQIKERLQGPCPWDPDQPADPEDPVSDGGGPPALSPWAIADWRFLVVAALVVAAAVIGFKQGRE